MSYESDSLTLFLGDGRTVTIHLTGTEPQHEPQQSPLHQGLVRLTCERLEDRSTPAKFSISLLSPLSGEVGDTAATHSGALSLSDTVVSATSATETVKSAFTGSISVLGGNTYTYSATNVGTEKPFQIESSGEQFAIALEDMAGQTGNDWDYNDRVWLMLVRRSAWSRWSPRPRTPGRVRSARPRP